jgi:hypothetical protein
MEIAVMKQPTNTPQRDSAQVRSNWRGKLHKLCRRRYGNHRLPNDASGRAMLTALLCFGLSAEAAMEDAPWLETAELEMMQRTATSRRRSPSKQNITALFASHRRAAFSPTMSSID